MKTPDDIKRVKTALECCSYEDCKIEDNVCPYSGNRHQCIEIKSKYALEYINELEERISLMMIQMHGDCGTCKHRDERGAICADCLQDSRRSKWEYEGLPEVKG